MSGKQSGNNFVKRCILSRRHNVDSDSADIMSSGRSFQICGLTTGKAQLVTFDRLDYYQIIIISAGRAKRSAARQELVIISDRRQFKIILQLLRTVYEIFAVISSTTVTQHRQKKFSNKLNVIEEINLKIAQETSQQTPRN